MAGDTCNNRENHDILITDKLMVDYFKTVTLGAFTWRNGERAAMLFAHIRRLGGGWIALHFALVTLCLHFPATLAMARLTPLELYSRLYGGNFINALPESARAALGETPAMDQTAVENFNALMLENGYGGNVLLPLLGMALGLTAIIQAVFYLCAVFFLGLSRMNAEPLSFRERLGLAVFSSTLPALAMAVFGLFLPTVHIIVFYFIVIFIIFQRSNICPNG
jgi:hypothetical protein